MENEIIKQICSLIQLDLDAIEAYEQALKNIDHKQIHSKLTSFQDDHVRHVNVLSEIVKKMGGTPPRRTIDIKGFFLSGFTAIRSLTGTVGALKAMVSNEELTTRTYEDALKWSFSAEVKEIIKNNFEDEKRHLNYIQKALADRSWENKAA